MPFDTTVTTPLPALADDALAALRAFFADRGHSPSSEQWDALRDLLAHLDRAARGALSPALYLSPIPPGTGKSQCLAAFARCLVASPAHRDAGMAIFVNRKTEARDMANAIGRGALCVITSDDEINKLGEHETADAAQVVVATQAALKMTMRGLAGQPFDQAARFHYLGRRRAVVAWDESLSFNRPVTLDADAAIRLSGAMRRQSDAAAGALLDWAREITGREPGLHPVPDFRAHGVDFTRLEDDARDDDDRAVAQALGIVSGNQGFTVRGTYHASTLVTHYPEIPKSVMPIIVTDASAKVNPSYRHMAAKGVPIVWLKDALKTYANMTLRIVPTAASRSVYKDRKSHRGRDLIDMAARYARSVAPAPVLVIGYKGRMHIAGVAQHTIEDAIRARLTEAEQPAFRYLHWGAHTSCNDHSDVAHVLLMGLNFLPRASGHATAGAALDLDLVAEHPTEDEVETTRRGLLKDAALQAILRGAARKAVGGDCGTMEVVIPQTKQTGLGLDEYRAMFPGACLREDTTLLPGKPLRGKLKELLEIVRRRLQAGETELTNPSLYEALGMQRANFARLVKDREWQAAIAALGLVPQRLTGKTMGLRKLV